ncbi:MAG: hypothetical protein ACYS0G_11385 [Planctomycetota bacterium]
MKIFALLTVLAAGAALIAGCDTTQDEVSYDAIRNDLTPELAGLVDRPDDIDRHIAVMGNANMRMFWDDVSRLWYIDHPSRLSPYPIVYTSGHPR